MTRQRRLQPIDALAERTADRNQLADRVWLTSKSLAAYLDFDGRLARKAAREFARTHGITSAHRGRTVLYLKADVDRAIGAGHLRTA